MLDSSEVKVFHQPDGGEVSEAQGESRDASLKEAWSKTASR
jgi:hypothetical protein